MASLTDVLNNIRESASYDYQRNVPVATRDNLRDIADIVMDSVNLQNDYVVALVNRISGERFTNKMYNNHLAKFRKGTNRYGTMIEEIYVNMAQAHEYNPAIAEREVYKREIPDINAVFHRRNSQLYYKQTIQYDSLYASFLSEQGMQSLVANIVNQMYGSANRDEYYQTKALLSSNAPYYYKVTVPAVNAGNANTIVTAIKTMSNMMEFVSSQYNHYGVDNFTEKSRQVLIMRADVSAMVDVNSLAMAFNLQYMDFVGGSYITVDSFGEGMEDVIAVLVDDEFFQIYDNMIKFTENYNGQGLYWQYFLHKWSTYSISPFSNAIAFTTANSVAVTSVEIAEGTTATMNKGETKVFNASVKPTEAQQSVRYTLTGANAGDTYVTATGLVHIGAEETASTVTLTATSVVDNTKKVNCTITINS